jgi:anaerobic selenocysteine-containing dehydrogenase
MLRAAPEGLDVDGAVALDAHAGIGADGCPRGFPTPTRRVEIYSERLLQAGYRPVPSFSPDDVAASDPDFPLRLGSAKTVAYCHSQHRNIASLRRLAPDPVVEIAPVDAATRSIAAGDWVRIRTRRGMAMARAAVLPGLAAGAVFAQHGWWADGAPGTPYDAENPLAANLNGAIDTATADPISGSIPLRASWCEVERM